MFISLPFIRGVHDNKCSSSRGKNVDPDLWPKIKRVRQHICNCGCARWCMRDDDASILRGSPTEKHSKHRNSKRLHVQLQRPTTTPPLSDQRAREPTIISNFKDFEWHVHTHTHTFLNIPVTSYTLPIYTQKVGIAAWGNYPVTHAQCVFDHMSYRLGAQRSLTATFLGKHTTPKY